MAHIKSTASEAEEACLFALQLATASVLPMTLKVAIELDLLEIIANAGPGAILASYLVLKCVEHIGGDMFTSVPKGDAIFLKWICHNWSDEECLRFLTNCYQALADEGKVVVAESILPEQPETSLVTKTVLQLDAYMLIDIPGGRERTEKEFEALAKRAGFKRFNKLCCAFNI
ncbi:hypothetical protein AgCh_014554 [Apium graveolens]